MVINQQVNAAIEPIDTQICVGARSGLIRPPLSTQQRLEIDCTLIHATFAKWRFQSFISHLVHLSLYINSASSSPTHSEYGHVEARL